MQMDIWIIDKINQLFMRGFLPKLNFQKNGAVSG